jgi:anti-anti-sigma factor
VSGDAPSADFAVSADRQDGAHVLAVSGELDMTTVGRFQEALDGAAQTSEPVVVDLSGVRFIDSLSLRALLAARERVARAGRRFAVACPPESPVRRVLSIAGTEEVFELYDERGPAVGAVSG